jgi:apolipoprotein N-acyltransferase
VKEGAQVIFWPETALPVYLRDGGYNYAVDSIYNFLDKNKVSLISGMPDLIYYKTGSKMPEDVKYNKSGNYYYATYNSVLLFSPFVLNIERYGKSKLVPFGERVPFVNALPFLRDFIKWSVGISDWNVGEDTTVFSVPLVNKDTLKINSLVCYESIYPYYVTRFVNKGADLISVVTNDSWYGNSSGPYQHKEIAVLRAVENRKTVIRAANGGISCIIDPMGRILTESKMYTRTEITGNVFIQEDETFFSKYPHLIPVISSVLSLWVLGIFILKKLKIRLGL